jgi:hypothetical protein
VPSPVDAIPEVPRVPAPWSLNGHGWIVVLRLAPDASARRAFVHESLRESVGGPVSLLMAVDYATAPCGPYRELLFIPGSMSFRGRRHYSISRILVSTWESVVNGRANWGIPKDRADFAITERATTTRLAVTSAGREVCLLEFAGARGPAIPVDTAWVPRRWRTLAQRHEGRTYVYCPEARASVRAARLLHWRFDPGLFPDLSAAKVLMALRVQRFAMSFPVATLE